MEKWIDRILQAAIWAVVLVTAVCIYQNNDRDERGSRAQKQLGESMESVGKLTGEIQEQNKILLEQNALLRKQAVSRR